MGGLCNMNDEIIELKEYKNIIENKKELDNKVKTVDDLSLEELEDVSNLYQNEVSKLSQEVNILEKENKKKKMKRCFLLVLILLRIIFLF